MIGLGATLVADDRTYVEAKPGGLHLSPHPEIAGMIEAREFGIIRLPHQTVCAALVCDLSLKETERLPHPRETVIDGCAIAMIRRVDSPAFPSMLCLHLRAGLES